MIYKVSKTSVWDDDVSPCEGAVKKFFQEDDREYWTIEINSIEELEKFVEEHGCIVFDGEKIEIYDDYRE